MRDDAEATHQAMILLTEVTPEARLAEIENAMLNSWGMTVSMSDPSVVWLYTGWTWKVPLEVQVEIDLAHGIVTDHEVGGITYS